MAGILIPSDTPGGSGPAGWGPVPTLGGSAASSIPSSTTTPSATQSVQGADAATQAVAQAIFLPPVPAQVIMAVDPSGALLRWFQILTRKLGGYTATPIDDALTLADDPMPSDDLAGLIVSDIQSQPDQTAALIADLYSQIDALTMTVEQPGVDGWNRQPAQIAATAVAPAGGVGAAAGAWDTAAHRDTAIAYINNVGTRLASLETALKTVGITF